MIYKGELISTTAHGEYMVFGEIFATLHDAKAAVDTMKSVTINLKAKTLWDSRYGE